MKILQSILFTIVLLCLGCLSHAAGILPDCIKIIPNEEEVTAAPQGTQAFAFSPDGKTCVVGRSFNTPDNRSCTYKLVTYSTDSWKALSSQDIPDYPNQILFSPDNKNLIVAIFDAPGDKQTPAHVYVYDNKAHSLLKEIDYLLDNVEADMEVRIDRTSRIFISTANGVDVYNYNDGYYDTSTSHFSVPYFNYADLSIDGQLLVIGMPNKFVAYRTKDWHMLADIPIPLAKNIGPQSYAPRDLYGMKAVISPDGNYVIVGVRSGFLATPREHLIPFRVYRTSDWKPVKIVFNAHPGGSGACFSPDSRLAVLTENNGLHFYDLKSHARINFAGNGGLPEMQFCPGKRLVAVLNGLDMLEVYHY